MTDQPQPQDTPIPPHRRERRLIDKIIIAFHFACDQGDLEVARRLLTIAETVLRKPPPPGRSERRTDMQPLVAAHERLWALLHPGVRVR